MALKTEIDDAIEAYRKAKAEHESARSEVAGLQFRLNQACGRARTASDKFSVAHSALLAAIGSPEDDA